MLQVERHHHKGNDQIVALCKTSKELYNKCNFLMRQAWFGDAPLPNINDLVAAVKDEDCFKSLHNTKTAKQTIRKVLTDWSNFKAALRAWKTDPTSFRKPKPPYYKKAMAQVIFYKETILGGQSGSQRPSGIGLIDPSPEPLFLPIFLTPLHLCRDELSGILQIVTFNPV